MAVRTPIDRRWRVAATLLFHAGAAHAANGTQPTQPVPAAVPTEAPAPARPWQVAVSYIGDGFANVAGGLSRGATYQGRLGLIADADLGTLIGWQGAAAHASLHQIHGIGITERVGALMTVTGIEAEPATRLFNLWVEQALGRSVSIRLGQFTAGQEFVISNTAAMFVNSTFGWPAILAQDLPSGGPAYPLATSGMRIAAAAGKRSRVLAVVLNGDPAGRGEGDPQRRDRDGLNGLVPSAPPLAIAEIQHALTGTTDAPGTMVRLGGWAYFGDTDDERIDDSGGPLAAPGSSGRPRQRDGNHGLYAILDIVHCGRGGATISGFARIATTQADRNLIDLYVDGGITFAGFAKKRPDDIAGLAVAWSRIGSGARGFDADRRRFTDPGTPARDRELVIELSYQARLAPHWLLQPDLQFIHHPGGSEAIPDALVVGIRNAIRF